MLMFTFGRKAGIRAALIPLPLDEFLLSLEINLAAVGGGEIVESCAWAVSGRLPIVAAAEAGTREFAFFGRFLAGNQMRTSIRADAVRPGDFRVGLGAQHLAGGYIELRAVPGTGEHLAVQFAFAEGAADMGAIVGEGVDAAVYFRQANRLAIGLYP